MTDLFGGNPTPDQAQPQEQQTAPQADPYATMLEGIRAEDGRQKYADVQTALQSIPHAQGRISELSAQVQQLQEELAKRKGVEDIAQNLQSTPSTPTPPEPAGMDEAALSDLIQKQLSQLSQNEQLNANREKVVSALKAKYGDKAKEEFSSKAKEMGVTPEWLTEQVSQYPDFVLNQFNIQKGKPPATINQGSVNPSVLQPHQPQITPVIRGASGSEVVDAYRQMTANFKGTN